MNRRDFLTGTAAGAAAIAGASLTGAAQGGAPAPAQGAGGQAGRGGGGGGRGGPAQVSPAKLARVSLMTLNFGNYRSDTNAAKTTPSPDRTLTVFDLPKMYVDMYGVHNIEFQLGDVLPSETDPNFI